ncbi:MAG: DEAD/DEAH box helicase family protein [Turicibacter sp.]|nr:DEAD/DEAH box helicase family protein [Turicibacter sp.]
MNENVQLITSNLIHQLEKATNGAESIYILTSFVMKSGVDVLRPLLELAIQSNIEIKICTGDYLYITQPDALEKLFQISPELEIRMYRSGGKSFHPKAYLFEGKSGDGIMIVGSSNMSRSALGSGVEWNLMVREHVGPVAFGDAISEFLNVHYHESTFPVNAETIKQYRQEYDSFHIRHADLATTWSEREEIDLMMPSKTEPMPELFVAEEEGSYQLEISPRFAQIPALEQLENTLEEGYNKAMVVMATGLGKTYLAGFFAKKFKRILFIAHLEEILVQAQKSFRLVIKDKSSGIYNGRMKEGEADVVFASIQTLSRKRHLENFALNDFDLIIVDEFHHASANTYQKVLEYFKPQFLLGITATPDRNDFRDIYSICDGNVAYRIDFLEAIQRGWLSPFEYFGVHDDTDYSQIRWIGNRYDAEELAQVQLKEDLAFKILKAWEKHKKTRTIVFCSSIRQATFLSRFFSENGYRTVALHSQSRDISRDTAISDLGDGNLDAIFTVDLLNEGVDIPTVDTLLFVRPTESLTIFTQQIGRGLRLHQSKEKCVVIDLIANYRNADIKMGLLNVSTLALGKKTGQPLLLPGGITINFELKARQLLEELLKKAMPRKEKLRHSYEVVKLELGRRPTYLELHKMGTEDSKAIKQEFKSYPAFLAWLGELNDYEKQVFLKYEAWFKEVESTGMNKSYKMIVLEYMLKKSPSHWFEAVSPQS